jgi:hypothetical protein
MKWFPYYGGLRLSSKSEDLPPFAGDEDLKLFGLPDDVPPPECRLPTLPIVRDQADLSNPPWDIPCCVSMALVQAMESLDLCSPPAAALSPLFHYYQLTGGRPGGASILDGILLALDRGVCRLDLHDPPMSSGAAYTAPTPPAIADARTRCITHLNPITYEGGYARLQPGDDKHWIRFLASGCPLILGFWLTDAYAALQNSNTLGSALGLPHRGAHSVVCLGYSLQHRCFLVKDSRGDAFGDGGFWWLPFERLAEGLVLEAWAICEITY